MLGYGPVDPPRSVAGAPSRMMLCEVVTVAADGTVDVRNLASRSIKQGVPIIVDYAPTVRDRVVVADLGGDPNTPAVVAVSTAAKPLDARVAALEAAVPSFYMRLENDVASAYPSGATTKIPMDTIVHESQPGICDLANDWATIPKTGVWGFWGGALGTAAFVVGSTYQTTLAGASGAWGSGAAVLGTVIAAVTSRLVVSYAMIPMRCTAGDHVFAQFFHNDGATRTADGLVGDFNFLKGVWIGP